MSEWTDELKAQVIQEYQAAEPTPENTMDLVSELATKHGFTVNGVRMILIKGDVYVAKGKAAAAAGEGKAKAEPRRSKQDSLDELTAILTDHGVEADEAIISKLTGKAADYFTASFKQIIEG